MSEGGEFLELSPENLRVLVARDTELSEILMRAFILRRLEMIRQGWGTLVVLGSQHSARTLEIREFLSRNGQPYTYVDLDRDQISQELLDRFEVKPRDVPVVVCLIKPKFLDSTEKTIWSALPGATGLPAPSRSMPSVTCSS